MSYSDNETSKFVFDPEIIIPIMIANDQILLDRCSNITRDELPETWQMLEYIASRSEFLEFPFKVISMLIRYPLFKKRLRDLPNKYPEYFL
jgi:hypothetical protein